jgi:hypothetical protein
MAKDQRNLPAFLGTDADFRAWGSGIAAQIAAMGLVQTADTGQINWTTVLRPAINTSAGYEMWRFADSLQVTKPVFIRMEYGIAAVADRPRLIVRVGTGTDGAGTLTGQVGTAVTLQTSGVSKTAGVVLPSLCSGSTSRLNLLTDADFSNTNFTFLICVERTKTNLGVDTGDGIATFFYSVPVQQFQAIPFSGVVPAGTVNNPAISPASTAAAISSIGPNVALSPTIVCLGKACFASWAAYISADIPKLGLISVDHLGAVRTMIPLGDLLSVGSQYVQGSISGTTLAMLWE